ncbi:hypothetical protein [Haloarchaeobius litoreus]|uniref:DUF7991 domain-containing protein n=1 Tax=Haloarchaeobius litoreus TaxID=755306 RepID=A0ABD6DMC0_9EURY|nr:hypothetical protein [Haloarchaeobius litoreus]
MVSLVGAIGLLVLVTVNTAIAAVSTRFFRQRLDTDWGSVVYVVLLTPVALLATTLAISGVLNLGADLGSQSLALLVAIALPLVLGVSVDFFWMPAPDEIELPDTMQE